jgi:hypothetical protein
MRRRVEGEWRLMGEGRACGAGRGGAPLMFYWRVVLWLCDPVAKCLGGGGGVEEEGVKIMQATIYNNKKKAEEDNDIVNLVTLFLGPHTFPTVVPDFCLSDPCLLYKKLNESAHISRPVNPRTSVLQIS